MISRNTSRSISTSGKILDAIGVGVVAIGLLFSCSTAIRTAQNPQKTSPDIEQLIDQLQSISDEGYGFSGSLTGSDFSPYADSAEVGMLLLGQPAPAKSSVMTEIVSLGAAAIPPLLKHLDDARPCKLSPAKGMMWMSFADEYDFNRRTRADQPQGVNRETVGAESHPPEHIITVGDLCFVALGQIVNRNFNATRYQPTGGIIVNSPSYSQALRDVVRKDFADFTAARHRQMLIDDFNQPDHEMRRIGAYQRLAFYYPAEVEPLVLKQLAVPTFDVIATGDFVRDQLYPEKSAALRRQLFDRYVAEHGAASSDGILWGLFNDLRMQEADEQHRLSPPLKDRYAAREMLIELYGYGPDVKSSQKPFFKTSLSADRARFIAALIHDGSKQIDAAVHQIFAESEADDYLALACMKRLLGRGFDDEIRRRCESRKGGNPEYAKVLDRLNNR